MRESQIPVLMYHVVHPDTSLISISPEIFSKQMEWLHDQGYHSIVFSELVDQLQNGNSIPNKTIVLTFDDGYASLYTYVVPVLLRYGFSATVFLVSGYCGRNNDWPGQLSEIPRMPLLDWNQIREMDESGIEIGAHTVNHPMLDRLEPDEMKKEIFNSKEAIERQLGHEISSFAYPYGRYNKTVKSHVISEFTGACSSKIGMVNLKSDPFEIERIDINYVKNMGWFRSLESKSFPYYLTARRSLRSISKVILNRSWW